ncbi:Kelch motif-containing protein [Filimonas lacunae]|uniref:Kelch motif-containing protein n=1 Tax=Filimonas lacunae TaxID=477680 RepID=A0A173M9N6_9BACT|nr:kelch repeat-containing protein [Filimonas lacunae]BAV04253.1 hypothetical protein FLA_0232 [Filimonas lacunae]SIT13524.1 Kelch motif-containing protein [Filimonas lacunae]
MKIPVLLFITVGAAISIASCRKSSDTPDTEEGNWVKRGQFDGPARTGAVSFVINDTAYVGTGYNYTKNTSYIVDSTGDILANADHYLKDFFKLNMPPVSTGNSQTGYTWTQVAAMPGNTHRAYGVGFSVNNVGYVGLGQTSNDILLKDFYAFDGYTWSKKKDFPGSARRDAVGFGLGMNGYITTGFDGANTQKDMYQYFPGDDHWEKITALSGEKRRGASVFVYKDKAYIFGGYSSLNAVTDMWAFDSLTLTWKVRNSIANESSDSYDDDYSDIVRQNASAFVIDNYGYVTNGHSSSEASLVRSTWRYDFENDRWTRRTPFEYVQRTYAVGFTVRNRGFVGAGQNGAIAYSASTYLEDFYEFIPSQTYDSHD